LLVPSGNVVSPHQAKNPEGIVVALRCASSSLSCPASAAFQKFLDLNKGKDSAAQKRIEGELGQLGGKAPAKPKKK
jgi:hypothetical protein